MKGKRGQTVRNGQTSDDRVREMAKLKARKSSVQTTPQKVS